jgi:hypothetical protein
MLKIFLEAGGDGHCAQNFWYKIYQWSSRWKEPCWLLHSWRWMTRMPRCWKMSLPNIRLQIRWRAATLICWTRGNGCQQIMPHHPSFF